jgi:hypothetical protein
MPIWRIKKDQQHNVENVGDLRRALEGVPDYMTIQTGLDDSSEEPFTCGVYVNDDDPEDMYFGISP